MALPGEAPSFWWTRPDWRAWSLWPVSAAYGAVAAYLLHRAPRVQVEAPVLCVGNFTVGGEGKTPVAIALAKAATAMGHRPGFLSRGHGGSHDGLHMVNAETDSARLVGDEPLLLARVAPTVVARDRAEGARHLIAEGCDLIIMDDGFQSAKLHMDFALMVVDARRGVGNGHVIPGGPLRAPLSKQMHYVDAVLTMGKGDGADYVVRRASRAGRPVFAGGVRPVNGAAFAGRRVLAFAGIGNPDKFYDTLRSVGADIVETRSFPDHHAFTEEELSELLDEAETANLLPVTTDKDLVRISNGMPHSDAFRGRIRSLTIEAVFEEAQTPARIIQQTLSKGRERLLRGLPGNRAVQTSTEP